MRKILVTFLITLSWTYCTAQTETLKIEPIKPAKFDKKRQLGIIIGVGTSQFRPGFSNWQQGNINYNDSLIGIRGNRVFKFELGFVYQVNMSKVFSIRPTYQSVFEGGQLNYERKTSTENINLSTYSHMLSFPIVINYPYGNFRPYLTAGPSLLYMMAQKKDADALLPINRFDLLGETVVGVDFYSKALKCIVSPGVKYSIGFLNSKGNADNIYGNTLDELKRQSISFTINLRPG